MSRVVLFVALISIFSVSSAFSAQVGLADWCVNVDGDISTACNGAGSGGSLDGHTINLGGFDTTLETGLNNNTLGSIVVTLGPGDDQSALVYMDYDIDFNSYGSFQDYGTVHGGPPSGVSYELNDPNTSNIFNDFADGTPLPNNNAVPTFGGPNQACCDVAWALGVGDINVPPGGHATVTFTVSNSAPSTSFYLQQTNGDLGNNIYLSENVTTGGSGPPPVIPEPREGVLLLAALAGAFFVLKKRKLQAS
jgi:hypothetical protein